MLFKPLLLQSWTELDETNAISARISLFPCRETQTRLQKWLPSPLSPTQLEGSRFHQSFLGGKATLIRGEGGRIDVVSDFHRQSSHSFRSVSTILFEIVAQNSRQESMWFFPHMSMNYV